MSESPPMVNKPNDDVIDLFELWGILWSEKKRIIGVSLVFGILAAVYSLWVTPTYESRVLLAPVSREPMSAGRAIASQLAPIAGIAGLSQQGPQVPLATLRSVQFAEDFIRRNDLLPILLEGSPSDGEEPDIRDAVKRFSEDVLKVNDEVESGLVTVTVTWEDPVVAARWANDIASFANETLRDRALADAERNVTHLKSELPLTSSVMVQQSIGRLLDQELQTVMIAKGNPEFAFKVIDPGKVPKFRSAPRRAQMTVLSLIAGGFLGILYVLWSRAVAARRRAASGISST
jgi:uncharacterized protein involved in exopolysaccharide biosynthesis